jgi:FkbM family methyltransferase
MQVEAVSKLRLALARPQYFWQPGRLLQRLFLPQAHGEAVVTLPWDLKITVDSEEQIGRAIANHGVYDIIVTEVLWRLAVPGEIALDVGANVGYTASIFARRLGPCGQLYAFEPHPAAVRLLKLNVQRWKADARCSPIHIASYALSDENGTAGLALQDGDNHTTAKLVATAGDFQVEKRRLDDCFGSELHVGVAKIDVEGHELQTLTGMQGFLERRQIRDVLFEELGEFPAPTHKLLASFGYTLFAFGEALSGVGVVRPQELRRKREDDPPNSYLATTDPERALARLKPKMWRSFGIGRLRGRWA